MDTIETLLTWIRDTSFGLTIAIIIIQVSKLLGPKDELLD
jgi:hypothetical protein